MFCVTNIFVVFFLVTTHLETDNEIPDSLDTNQKMETFKVGCSEKIDVKLQPGSCMFCSAGFTKSNACVNADILRLDNLFEICQRRNDIIGKLILDNKANILSGVLPLQYHRACRAKYQAINKNTKKYDGNCDDIDLDIKLEIETTATTRSSTEGFDFKTHCFICGDLCDSRKEDRGKQRRLNRSWSMVESAVDSDAENIYNKVYKAAEQKNDNVMLHRLRSVVNGDLVAVEAKYHRNKACVVQYLRDCSKSVNEFETKRSPLGRPSQYTKSLLKLKTEVENNVINQKAVYQLSALKERFLEILKEDEIPVGSLQSRNFKRLLSSVWPEVSFIHQNGSSDLVCSSHLSVGEALKKIEQHEVQSNLTAEYECASNEFEILEDTDESIVHKAVGILRKRILEKTEKHEQHYYSVDELSLESQKAFIDPLLHKAIFWLSNASGYSKASGPQMDILDPKLLAIASDITTIASMTFSPKHLGLATHVFNEFGSRHLIEVLNTLGHCVSYSELRRFQTSAAYSVVENSCKTESGGIVPQNLTSRQNGGKLIVACGDNWDHNERTVDGKRTTHAMTSILVSTKMSQNQPNEQLQRVNERSFDNTCVPGGSLCRVVPYMKPSVRPSPSFTPPATVPEMTPTITENIKKAKLTELLYNMGRCARLFCDDLAEPVSNVPHWGVYHSFSDTSLQQESEVVFNPILMAKPNDYSTLYTTLLRMKECVQALGQEYVPVCFDMGLLCKVHEILWYKKEELSCIIPIEGGMHFLMSIFAGIGKLYGEIGLRQLLIDSGQYASGTVSNIMSGKDFDRCLTACKLIDEALQNRFLINFETWCNGENRYISEEILNMLHEFRQSESKDLEVREKLIQKLDEALIPLFEEYRKEGRLRSPTFKLWDDFLHNVSLPLKLFVQSTRLGNWEVHKYAKLALLPILFVSDRMNYSRYMTIQALQMNRLPADVEMGFNEGLFTAKLSNSRFNNVWMDYTLETTQNKALKGSGGIIGLSLRDNALARWFLARPVTSQYSVMFNKTLVKESDSDENKKFHGDTKSKREFVNKSVITLTGMFDSAFIDPFDLQSSPDNLVNFATGEHVPKESEDGLLNCLETGKAMMEKFVSERLVVQKDKTEPQRSFFDPMPRSKIKPVIKHKSTKSRKQTVSPNISSDMMFQRLLAVNAYKKVPSNRLFQFENTAVPISLFSEDGSILSGKKSDFMNKLESLLDTKMTHIDGMDSLIYDGMALVQILSPLSQDATFNEMASQFMQYVLMKSGNNCSKEIHIVFDKYFEKSIKTQTRQKRGDSKPTKHIHIKGDLKIPKDWKGFLAKGENKQHLIEFYTGFVKENAPNQLGNITMYISGGQGHETIEVTVDNSAIVPELKSNQEEADTRIILHAIYAADKGANRIVCVSPDTDVLVLLLHHRANIHADKLYMYTGRVGLHTDLKRYIAVHDLYGKLSPEQQHALLYAFCISGCDTCSFLRGKGKKTMFKLMITKPELFDSCNDFNSSRYIVSELYGHPGSGLHDIRALKAKSSTNPRQLPPTENSLYQHHLRCVLQMKIWQNASVAMYNMPDPLDYGYSCDEEGLLHPVMMTQPLAAPELLNDVVCHCSICNSDCICSLSMQPCSFACDCGREEESCTNIYSLEVDFPWEYDT